MKKPAYIIILLIFYFFISKAYSQTGTFPVLSMDVQTTPISNNSSGGLPDLTDSTIFNVQMHISLFDTTDIDEIYVNLGEPGSPGSKLQQTFDWDVSGAAGNGTSYSRTGYNIMLGLGDFMSLLNYEASISIKRTDGSFTDVINFSR